MEMKLSTFILLEWKMEMYLNMFLVEKLASSSSYFIQCYEMCSTNKTAIVWNENKYTVYGMM